jgi:hypothetical protein
MCDPPIIGCVATHFPFLIDRSLAELQETGREVSLSPEAQKALYEYGSIHKDEFEAALNDPNKFAELSKALGDKLEEAGIDTNNQHDPIRGRTYHPRRVGGDQLRQVLGLPRAGRP